MFERYDEAELLAWIEGSDLHSSSALDERLASDPAVRAALEAMRADREVLRSLGAPAPPRRLLAEMEARLARPMLIESRPGAYRRAHRRPQRRARLVRFAALGLAAVVVAGAAWLAITAIVARSGAPGSRAPERGTLVEESGAERPVEVASADSSSRARTTDEGAALWPPPGTTVHHHLPGWSATDDAPRVAALDPGVVAVSQGEAVVASFAVVVRADDFAGAERALAAAIVGAERGSPGEAALVRNFSMEEAKSLLEGLIVTGGGSGGASVAAMGDLESALASSESSGRTRGLIAEGLREARRRSAGADGERLFSRQLLGDPSRAASYERQLELSSRGATHTLTLDAGEVADWLVRLRDAHVEIAAIRPLDGRAAAPAAPDSTKPGPLGDWVAELRVIRSAAEALRKAEAQGRAVLLPVIVETNH